MLEYLGAYAAVMRGLLAPGIAVAPLVDNPCRVFEARGGHTPVTVGVDIVVAPLRDGRSLALLDMEGIDHFDHDALTVLLGFLMQHAGRIAFLSDTYHNSLFDHLSRTAAASRILTPGQERRRAPLHLIFNKRLAEDAVLPAQLEADDRFRVRLQMWPWQGDPIE